jgi:hypothetical protein
MNSNSPFYAILSVIALIAVSFAAYASSTDTNTVQAQINAETPVEILDFEPTEITSLSATSLCESMIKEAGYTGQLAEVQVNDDDKEQVLTYVCITDAGEIVTSYEFFEDDIVVASRSQMECDPASSNC